MTPFGQEVKVVHLEEIAIGAEMFARINADLGANSEVWRPPGEAGRFRSTSVTQT